MTQYEMSIYLHRTSCMLSQAHERQVSLIYSLSDFHQDQKMVKYVHYKSKKNLTLSGASYVH